MEQKAEKRSGRRHYIAQFETGDILFGIRPYFFDFTGKEQEQELASDRCMVMICSGLTKSRLVQIPISELQKGLMNTDMANLINSGIKKWVQLLSENEINHLTKEEFENGISLNMDNLMDGLNRFNQAAMKSVALSIADIYGRERQQLQHKHEEDETFIKASLQKLVTVTKKKKADRLIGDQTDYSENPLAAACQMVGEATGITMKLPPATMMNQSKNLFYDIMKASQIRFRPIVLSGEWWEVDNGPLLAFLSEERLPVALIPIANNKYKIINPADGSEKLVEKVSANILHPRAYMFYKVLPNKELKLEDLIKFCMQGSIRKDMILLVLIGFAGGILSLFVPIANRILFNNIVPEGNRGQLLQIFILLVSFGISSVLFQVVRSFAMLRVENRTEASLQAAAWDRVISLPVPFFKQLTAGELAMKTMGFSKIRKEISGTVITTMLSTIFSLLNLILLFYYNKKMGVYALLLIAIAIIFTYLCGKFQLNLKRELNELSNKITGQVLQMIGGISRFRVAGAEKRAFFQWAKAFARQRKIEYRNEVIDNTLTTFNSIFPIIATMLIFIAAFYNRNLGTGSFIAFNSAFTGIMTAMVALSAVILSINTVITIYECMEPILQTKPEYDEWKEDPGELDGSIELSHITFRYQPDASAVINDLSLRINKGEYLAIVGPSGCGKSTILRLLLGFEKPEAGNIYYGGHDINKVDIRAIRKQLGVVMQNSQLMIGDIRSNVLGTNPNLTIEDAVEALKMAGIYQDIEAMPMGIFTVISEGGSTLSGGQRQRLLIARVLVNKPKIIFFDEATSALDNKTQAIVSKSLDALDATKVVIAHRLSTIINCDRILVIDKGCIIEEGKYEDLMKKEGTFYELAKRQLA
jgi:ATP-binding cassette subfamily C protein